MFCESFVNHHGSFVGLNFRHVQDIICYFYLIVMQITIKNGVHHYIRKWERNQSFYCFFSNTGYAYKILMMILYGINLICYIAILFTIG